MKNKVKKRVNENKSSSGLVFLWSIFIILLIACGVLYLGKDSLIQVNIAQDRLKTEETPAHARKLIPTDSEIAAQLETEFNKKRQNAMDMLLKSKYFGYSRASPAMIPAV